MSSLDMLSDALVNDLIEMQDGVNRLYRRPLVIDANVRDAEAFVRANGLHNAKVMSVHIAACHGLQGIRLPAWRVSILPRAGLSPDYGAMVSELETLTRLYPGESIEWVA